MDLSSPLEQDVINTVKSIQKRVRCCSREKYQATTQGWKKVNDPLREAQKVQIQKQHHLQKKPPQNSFSSNNHLYKSQKETASAVNGGPKLLLPCPPRVENNLLEVSAILNFSHLKK